MRYSNIITRSEMSEIINRNEETAFTLRDIFYEGRDEYPLREFVIESLCVEFTHPGGVGTVYQDLPEGIHERSREWTREILPENSPEEVKTELRDAIESLVKEHSQRVYKKIQQDAKTWSNSTNWKEYVPDQSETRPEELQILDAWVSYKFDSHTQVGEHVRQMCQKHGVPETA